MDKSVISRYNMSDSTINVIKFIEEVLEIQYHGYSTPEKFIEDLYCSAKVRHIKRREVVLNEKKKERDKRLKKHNRKPKSSRTKKKERRFPWRYS